MFYFISYNLLLNPICFAKNTKKDKSIKTFIFLIFGLAFYAKTVNKIKQTPQDGIVFFYLLFYKIVLSFLCVGQNIKNLTIIRYGKITAEKNNLLYQYKT